MQDNEFDQLFNSKLSDFEMEPSPMVWDNIADGLDGKKTKPVMIPWLSIAATVLILMGVGVFFLQKGEVVKDQGKQNKPIANNVEAPVAPKQVIPAEDITTKQPDNNVASVVKHRRNTMIPANNSAVSVSNTREPVIKTSEPVKTDNTPLIAAAPDPASTRATITATVPDVKMAPTNVEIAPQVEKSVIPSINKDVTAPVKRRGIHNLGGLINAIVAKVDKREDKLIEFSDSEDDDTQSNVTGINLGLIRIKKQQ